MARKEMDWANIGFAYHKTDKRYVSDFKDGKWDDGRITEDATIVMSEDAGVLHYAQEIFEGLKAYETEDGHIVTFRPDLNAERMMDSAKRLEMPPFPKERFMDAVEQVDADVVYVLPNNKNIILAANQAGIMMEDKDQGKRIMVIPTRTIPQGIAAILTYMPDVSAQENADAMTETIGSVASGEVTYAVRDTVIDDVSIRQGDYMGIGDKGILSVGRQIQDVAFDMIEKLTDDSKELISIYYGAEIAEDEAGELRERVARTYPSCDVELQYGGQPIYYYIVSAE